MKFASVEERAASQPVKSPVWTPDSLRRINDQITIRENRGLRTVNGFLAGARFSKLPVITGPVKLFCFSFQRGLSFNCFENFTLKLSVKETKWTSLEVRTRPTFLETLISKYDFGPVKLPGLSRNGPPARLPGRILLSVYMGNFSPVDWDEIYKKQKQNGER